MLWNVTRCCDSVRLHFSSWSKLMLKRKEKWVPGMTGSEACCNLNAPRSHLPQPLSLHKMSSTSSLLKSCVIFNNRQGNRKPPPSWIRSGTPLQSILSSQLGSSSPGVSATWGSCISPPTNWRNGDWIPQAKQRFYPWATPLPSTVTINEKNYIYIFHQLSGSKQDLSGQLSSG